MSLIAAVNPLISLLHAIIAIHPEKIINKITANFGKKNSKGMLKSGMVNNAIKMSMSPTNQV